MGSLLVRDVSDDLVGQMKERPAPTADQPRRSTGRSCVGRLAEDDGARFEELAAQLRALTAGSAADAG